MIVRGLPAERFAADHPRLTVAYLEEQERLGCACAAWRFAWVEGGEVGARVAYWGFDRDTPVLVDIVLDDDAGHAGAVLAESLDALGLGAIDYQVARELGGARSPRTEPAALEACGFRLLATQRRFEHTGDVVVPPAPAGVETRAADDDVLAPLIEAVRVGSADRASREHDAQAELAMLSQLDRDVGWWEIAVDRASGRPLGFVLPARTDGPPVIAFIGVVPAARGCGIGRWLLARGTAAVGERVVADIDEENPAMLRVAAAVGYRLIGARAHYRRGG